MENILSKLKERKIRDVSFLSTLLRRFIIILLLTFPIVIVVCMFFRTSIQKEETQRIENTMSNIALELIQLEDTELAADKSALLSNVWLSTIQDEWRNNPYISDSSISFYNLSEKKLIAKSFEVPIILSDEVLKWWEKEADVEIGTPKVSLSNEMISFCEEYRDKTIYIEKMVYMNEVLCPEKIIVLDKKGNEEFSCSAVVPSVPENRIYNERVELKLIGNRAGESIYTTMADFTFFEIEISDEEKKIQETEASTEEIEKKEGNKEFSVKYSKAFDEKNVTMKTKTFSINDIQYQLDYAYKLNFLSGAWGYMILINAAWILVSALLSIITTRDSYKIFS